MHPDIERHLPEVSEAVRALERALGVLSAALAHGDVRIATDGAATTGAPHAAMLRAVTDAYTTIDYGSEDEVNETHDCLGVVGASRELVRLAVQVNTAKEGLKRTCAPLSRRRIRLPERAGGTRPTRAIPLSRAILRTMGRADVNLLAAYRQIPILERPPASVSYVRAVTRAVYRRSREAVLEMLEHSDDPQAPADRARIRACRDRWFALVDEHAPNVRANVVFDGLDRRGRGRVQVRAELPLLFVLGRDGGWPEIRFPSGPGADRPTRERVGVLEPEPYLASTRIFRYARTG